MKQIILIFILLTLSLFAEDNCNIPKNRYSTGNNAICRVIFEKDGDFFVVATAWIFDAQRGYLATAGHVLDRVNDINRSYYVEFNVLNSEWTTNPPCDLDCPVGDPNCQPDCPEGYYPMFASTDIDRFPIILTSIIRDAQTDIWPSDDTIWGDDWAIFKVDKNSYNQTIIKYGSELTPTQIMPQVNSNLIVTGYGSDNGVLRFTQQASEGFYKGMLDYNIIKARVYLTSGNSGSPIIDDLTGNVIGVHNGGTACKSGYDNTNVGTAFTNDAFWRAVEGVTLNQVFSNNSKVTGSKIKQWDGSTFENKKHDPGTVIHPALGETITLKGDIAKFTSIMGEEKYYYWNEDLSNVINFKSFEIMDITSELTSHFNETSTITLQNNFLEDPSLQTGTIGLKDPWYRDYNDPGFANTARNRGMDNDGDDALHFTDIASHQAITPDGSHQGVFLGQGYDDPDKPYYSVKAETQSAGGTRWDFYGWGKSGATLQNWQNAQTAVVFNQPNATVTAHYKGHLRSNKTEIPFFLYSSHKGI